MWDKALTILCVLVCVWIVSMVALMIRDIWRKRNDKDWYDD